ncbi:hypothetical protein PMIN04_005890 [Paraphaeosphaeria minitans]
MSYTTDASRWRALSTRDPLAATAFVYTVKSTRIYCRPTCPARLARRANVGFCSSPGEASALGFRPCKRCKPDVSATEDPREKAVARACGLIEETVRRGEKGREGLRLQDLAMKVGLTPRYFHKIFKERMGVTPREWARGKMGGVDGEGERKETGETRTPSLVRDSPPEVEGFDLDRFDFNELVGFDVEAGTMEDPMATGPAMAPMEGFGDPSDVNGSDVNGSDVNGSMCGWDTFASDYLGEGFRLDDALPKWANGSLVPDAAMAKTSATFEQDAALLLGMGCVPELNETQYADALG